MTPEKRTGRINGAQLWANVFRIIGVINAIVAPLILYMFASVIDLDRRVSTIESNRFTSRDALDMQIQINERLADRPTRAEVPPAWFIDRVTKLEERVTQLERAGPR